MILNHGNIRKTKLIKYMFLENLPLELHQKKCEEYHKTIENEEFSEYLSIEKYLHDSIIVINKCDFVIRITFEFWNEEKEKSETISIIFQNAKIISWNKCRRSGHLSKMNRKVNPHRFGYCEFYTDNGIKYISIVILTKSNNRINTGIYFPIVTIRYKRMIVEDA